MSISNISYFKKIIITILTCTISALIGFVVQSNKTAIGKVSASTLLRHSDEKIIEKKEFPDEPFEFSNLKVKHTKIALKQKFSARALAEKAGNQSTDWIENLEFSIKNASPKRMTYISIELDFPETTTNGPMMVYNQLGIGVHPKALTTNIKSETPLALESGDVVNFTMSPQRLQILKDFLASRNFQLADLNQVVVRIEYIFFDDGMKWAQGQYYRPNPNTRSGYELITSNNQ